MNEARCGLDITSVKFCVAPSWINQLLVLSSSRKVNTRLLHIPNETSYKMEGDETDVDRCMVMSMTHSSY